MNQLVTELENWLSRVHRAWAALHLDQKKNQLARLQERMQESHFWDDRQTAEHISQEAGRLQHQIDVWSQVRDELTDLLSLASDETLTADITERLQTLGQTVNQLEFELLLQGPHDTRPAIITIYAGAGGVDAQDWAEMIERMYLRLAERQNWKVEVLNRTVGQEAGIKNSTLKITGPYAYGYLKTESGVHRLVRLSPYDSDQARHTSFAMAEVLPELDESSEIQIDDKDLRIDVYRSSGKGGQSVNTTDSAVRITHIPTGIVVTCQNERSQMQNKEQARKYLLGKLEVYYQSEKDEERQALRGELTEAAWGNQIRSYVLHPYKMVKDHRTKYETKDPQAVLDGDLMEFMKKRLEQQAGMGRV